MNRKKNNLSNSNLTELIITALFTAILAVSAQIIIPNAVPFTLQSLGVFLASAILGWKKGVLSVVIYVMVGAIGLPVFSGFQGGMGVLLGVTGGYIWGFIPTAFIVGIMCEKLGRKKLVLILSMVIGLIMCYILGTVWYSVYTSTGFMSALAICVVPFIIADIIKIAVAVMIVSKLEKVAPKVISKKTVNKK